MEGRDTFWSQVFVDEDYVTREESESWAKSVVKAAAWMAEKDNWKRRVGDFAWA